MRNRFCFVILTVCFAIGVCGSTAILFGQDCDSCDFKYDDEQNVYVLTSPCQIPDCFCPIPDVKEEDNPPIKCIKAGVLEGHNVQLTLSDPGGTTYRLHLALDKLKWKLQGSQEVTTLQIRPGGKMLWEIQLTKAIGEFKDFQALQPDSDGSAEVGQSLLRYDSNEHPCRIYHYYEGRTGMFQVKKDYQLAITRKAN